MRHRDDCVHAMLPLRAMPMLSRTNANAPKHTRQTTRKNHTCSEYGCHLPWLRTRSPFTRRAVVLRVVQGWCAARPGRNATCFAKSRVTWAAVLGSPCGSA